MKKIEGKKKFLESLKDDNELRKKMIVQKYPGFKRKFLFKSMY